MPQGRDRCHGGVTGKGDFTRGKKIANAHIRNVRRSEKGAFHQRGLAHKALAGLVIQMRRVLHHGAAIAAKGLIGKGVHPIDGKGGHQWTATGDMSCWRAST